MLLIKRTAQNSQHNYMHTFCEGRCLVRGMVNFDALVEATRCAAQLTRWAHICMADSGRDSDSIGHCSRRLQRAATVHIFDSSLLSLVEQAHPPVQPCPLPAYPLTHQPVHARACVHADL